MSIAKDLTPVQSQSVIYSELLNQGIPDPLAKLVTAQSGHETNGWTSSVYLNDNNAFGFGYDGVSSYYGYNSVEESVADLAAWLGYKYSLGKFPALSTVTTADQYAQLLKANSYYGDTVSNYTSGIKRWFSDNIEIIAGSISIVALAAIAFVMWWALRH